jgi:hypothetical protein
MMQLLSKLYKTYCFKISFDKKIITDLKHTDQHIASFNCYWGYSLANTYLCTDGYHNKTYSITGHDNHMGS